MTIRPESAMMTGPGGLVFCVLWAIFWNCWLRRATSGLSQQKKSDVADMLLGDERRWQWLAANGTAAFFNSRAPRMILLSRLELDEHMEPCCYGDRVQRHTQDDPDTTLTLTGNSCSGNSCC